MDFGKFMYNKLGEYLNKHITLTDYKIDFRSNLNTSDAIITILDTTYHGLDKKNLTARSS